MKRYRSLSTPVRSSWCEQCRNEREAVFVLTYLQHGSEHGAVMCRGAVPPSVPELPLALGDACPRAPPDAAHVVLVQLA